jgi:hypothetical protein
MEAIDSIKPDFIMIDSIQTMCSADSASAPGSVTQVRECTQLLIHMAKNSETPVFIVGHVNKDGGIAGPKVLEHMVDGRTPGFLPGGAGGEEPFRFHPRNRRVRNAGGRALRHQRPFGIYACRAAYASTRFSHNLQLGRYPTLIDGSTGTGQLYPLRYTPAHSYGYGLYAPGTSWLLMTAM